MGSSRPAPVFSHNAATGTGPGNVIDISTGDDPKANFVMVVSMTPGSAVAIEGSHDATNFFRWEPVAGYNSNVAKRLEFGVRYWRTNIITNAGTVSSSVGETPMAKGGWHRANNLTGA